jgi:hypothetical protein
VVMTTMEPSGFRDRSPVCHRRRGDGAQVWGRDRVFVRIGVDLWGMLAEASVTAEVKSCF